MKEIWKYAPGFNDSVKVSNLGKVIIEPMIIYKKKQKELTMSELKCFESSPDDTTYKPIVFSNGFEKYSSSIHRLTIFFKPKIGRAHV